MAISSSAAPESVWHKCPIRTAGHWESRFVLRLVKKHQRRISRGGLVFVVAGGDGSFCQCWDNDCWCRWVAASLSLFVLLVILPCVACNMSTNQCEQIVMSAWFLLLLGFAGWNSRNRYCRSCASGMLFMYHHNSLDQTARSTKDLLDKLV